MNIIVCAKQILDPQVPPAKFRIDPAANRVIPPEGMPPVMSPFDEQALEAALRVKQQAGGKITTITVGPASARDILKHALAMGSDEAVLIEDPAFEGSDSFATAYVLSQAIRKIGSYDLVLCGRQASDWDAGIVGSAIAENLGIPVITIARKVEAAGDKLRVERTLADGYEALEVPAPALVTIGDEIGQPRLPTGMGIVMAARKQVPVWKAADLDVDASKVGAGAGRSKLVKLFIPTREGECQIIDGESPAEAAAKLARRLREAQVI